MVQYIAKINPEKLTKEMRNWQKQNAPEKASKQHFHLRVADEAVSDELSGYKHNGVIPIMMK